MYHEQHVVVEQRNAGTFLYFFESNKPITVEKVAKKLRDIIEFDEERDSFSFVDSPEIVQL